MSLERSAPHGSAGGDLLDRLERFLLEHVESYEELEVLLLVARSRDLAWSIEATCKKLELSELIISEALEGLCRRGLLARLEHDSRTFFYAPRSRRVDEMVIALAEAYESQRLEIMKAMTTNSIQRLRTTAADAFDAFANRRKPGA